MALLGRPSKAPSSLGDKLQEPEARGGGGISPPPRLARAYRGYLWLCIDRAAGIWHG